MLHVEPLKVNESPPRLTARQNEVVGHDTETSFVFVTSAIGAAQDVPAYEEAYEPPTAAQKLELAQETAAVPRPLLTGLDH